MEDERTKVVNPGYFEYLKSLGQQPEWKNPEVKWLIEKLELSADKVAEILQEVGRVETEEEVLLIWQNAYEELTKVRLDLASIQCVIPIGLYYRYRYKIKFVMERLICLVSYMMFLRNDADFMEAEEVAKFFGVEYSEDDTLFDLETYLIGLLLMADELLQLCMKDVINGHYNRLIKIMKFLKVMNEGFSLLNFKNDFLRRKYDSLKYCIREIEMANDDLLMHGLKEKDTLADNREVNNE